MKYLGLCSAFSQRGIIYDVTPANTQDFGFPDLLRRNKVGQSVIAFYEKQSCWGSTCTLNWISTAKKKQLDTWPKRPCSITGEWQRIKWGEGFAWGFYLFVFCFVFCLFGFGFFFISFFFFGQTCFELILKRNSYFYSEKHKCNEKTF